MDSILGECGSCANGETTPGVMQAKACSGSPIFFGNGAVSLKVTDLASPLGGALVQTRSYVNQATANVFGAAGWNWMVPQAPRLVPGSSTAIVMMDPNRPYWFDTSNGTTFTARYGILGAELTYGGSQYTFALRRPGATETIVFDSIGRMASRIDATGMETTATYANGMLTILSRTVNSVIERLRYTYSYQGAGWVIATVTLSRQAGGVETDIRRVAYTYYAAGHDHGDAGDLKTVTEQQPASGGGWEDTAMRYHRYYKSGSSDGFPHGLKMHIGPEGYRQAWNDGINLETAADSTLRLYSEHYFKYDPSTRAATFEDAAICPRCPRGATGDTFAITQRTGGGTGVNSWRTRCEVRFRDNSKEVVYSNSTFQPIFKIQISPDGNQEWYHFYQYDGDGRLIVEAMPSALTGYNESYDDLVNWAGGTYVRASDGLIKTYDYHTSDPKYLKTEYVCNGKNGTQPDNRIKLRAYTYSASPNGPTVYVPASTTVYLDAADDTKTAVTSFSYTWHSGTNRMASRTTTLPTVPTDQNGSNTLDTIVETFDTYGNLTQRTDERGIVNTYEYDVVLGVMTRQTLNYQSGVTAVGVNVVSDFTFDEIGRQTQALGPSHTAEVGGSATTVRTASWTVYKPSVKPVSGTWGLDEVRSGNGYATGSSPSYTYTLVNPATIARNDKDGRNIDQITNKRTTGSGKLSAGDTFAQTDWKSWSSSQYSSRGRLLSQRVYHDIPSSGEGVEGTSYGQTSFLYDDMDRRIRVIAPCGTSSSPAGTITRTVYAPRSLGKQVWAGTDDTGATESNPAGSGSPNNMVKITSYEYDGDQEGGDGNLTKVTQHLSGSSADDRVTSYGYDWRDRRTSEDGEIDIYVESTYDNLDRVTRTDRKNTSSGGNLIGRNETKYDKRGRVYQRLVYAVDPGDGSVGNALTENNWYDAGGNLIKQIAAGAGIVFSKTAYNGVGWVTATYTGYNTTNDWSTANSLSGDTIVEQMENTYDEAGNVISVANYQRLNDATGTGALTAGTQPKARVSYSASWYDGIGRAISNANYGAISSFTRPTTTPSRSDDVLVTTMVYDDAGRVWKVIDPKAIELWTTFDAVGRKTQTIEAYGTGVARTTQWTYVSFRQA